MKKSKCNKRIDIKTARLNILINSELKDWVHAFASQKGRSISSIVNDYLVLLREKELGDQIDQI